MKHTTLTLLLMAFLFCTPSFAQEPNLGLINRVVLGDRQPPSADYRTVTQPQTRQYPPLPRADYISRKPVNLNGKEKKALKLSNEWKDRPVNPVMVKNGQIKYELGATMPTII